jgi:hypothetical protein
MGMDFYALTQPSYDHVQIAWSDPDPARCHAIARAPLDHWNEGDFGQSLRQQARENRWHMLSDQ